MNQSLDMTPEMSTKNWKGKPRISTSESSKHLVEKNVTLQQTENSHGRTLLVEMYIRAYLFKSRQSPHGKHQTTHVAISKSQLLNFHTTVKKNNEHLSKELEHGLSNFTSHFLSQKTIDSA